MTLTDERPEPKTVTDHAFLPSNRPDSCDFVDWRVTDAWLACGKSQAAHEHQLFGLEWLPGPFCSESCGPAHHVDTRLPGWLHD